MSLYESEVYLNDLRVAFDSVIGREKLENKRILITGATGTIGSFLTDTLLECNKVHKLGIRLFLAVRNKNALIQKMADYGSDAFELLEYDMNKCISFDEDVDYIIHLSGNAYPAAFCNNPVGTIMGNVNSTYNLLEYARCHNVSRFIYVSSGEVYGQGSEDIECYDEEYAGYIDIDSPRNCYPMSKRTAENLCASYYYQYRLETLIVRPCHTYGPVATSGDNRATVQFFDNAVHNSNIVLKSKGNQLRSYAYVADCVSGLLSVMLSGAAGETYNIANSESQLTIAQFAGIVAQNQGVELVYSIPSAEEKKMESPIPRQVLDAGKIERLGWRGKYTPEEGIKHVLCILRQ